MSKVRERLRNQNLLFIFMFVSGPSTLDDACPHGWGQIALLSLLNQMLIFSRSTHTNTPMSGILLAI